LAAVDSGRVGSREVNDDFVFLAEAGDQRAGEFHCAECGYGIMSRRALPPCPMCHGNTWDGSPWRRFGRTRR
jgi:hypothetical protein